jgi:poly-beta-1,6-N-acetyl-D-glucosamine N-deacetylase
MNSLAAYRPLLAGLAAGLITSLMVDNAAWAQGNVITGNAALKPTTVVIAYYRFGEDAFPDSSVRLDQFNAHLDALTEPNINVVDLPAALAALDNSPIAENTNTRQVAITIDNAYSSVYDEAWPRLRAAGLPFTLFIATDLIDGGAAAYMNWDQVREMADAGVTIGLRGAAHAHLPALGDLPLLKDIRHALSRVEAELGITPRLFSYPYGEYGNRVINVLDSHGFVAAFGQHSGVMSATMNRFALPRFPITELFADIDRFELAINALPLLVDQVTPGDHALDNPRPQVGFTVADSMGDLSRLNCFASDQGQLTQTQIGRRIELKLHEDFTPGRARINCTKPVTQRVMGSRNKIETRWRWFGLHYYIPDNTASSIGGLEP